MCICLTWQFLRVQPGTYVVQFEITDVTPIGRLSSIQAKVACPGFHSMKQLRVMLLLPGRDDSPSQGYPQQHVAGIHLYTWMERDNVGKSFLSKETTRWQATGPRTTDLQI